MALYAVTFENVAVTAASDLFEITPAASHPCVVHACYLSQSTELQEAQEEQLRLSIVRGHTTSGSGGSAATPAVLDSRLDTAEFTADVNNTTVASAGTTVTLHAETFNVRAGWAYVPAPEARPIVTADETTLVVRLLAAPADSVTMGGTLIVEEL